MHFISLHYLSFSLCLFSSLSSAAPAAVPGPALLDLEIRTVSAQHIDGPTHAVFPPGPVSKRAPQQDSATFQPPPATEPTVEPATEPTIEPAPEPTLEPTPQPTLEPAAEPTFEPAPEPAIEPTTQPAVQASEPTAAASVGKRAAQWGGQVQDSNASPKPEVQYTTSYYSSLNNTNREPNHDEAISEFSNLTGVAPPEARRYLESSQWDLEAAATEYYTSLEEAAEGQPPFEPAPEVEESLPDTPPALSGEGRTLGGDNVPQPIPTTSKMPDQPSSSSKAAPKKKFATLGDLSGGGSAGNAGHGHDDDGDDNDYDPKQDLFAGGEKSGLAVQNPDDLKKKILERARKNLPRPTDPSAPSAPAPTNFSGTARTLGGDDTPSQVIQDPTSNAPRRAPPVERVLHFWSDGFSVDDGPLYRNDDPANAEILAHIRQGRAPMDILNVERSQEVDVKLDMHDEKYKPPKKKYKPFEGGGQRLGSPTPGDAITSSSATTSLPSMPTANAATSLTPPSVLDIDDSAPTLSIQIRLGDGTRLVSRFNTTHTIGDVYSFVRACQSEGKEFALMTTFPSTELKDMGKVLGEMSEFKRGGTVVQKWL
ncbi:MAG: hypothetical protein Q9166_004516 [cf. Caloplaca sp. 2 TL-2023]